MPEVRLSHGDSLRLWYIHLGSFLGSFTDMAHSFMYFSGLIFGEKNGEFTRCRYLSYPFLFSKFPEVSPSYI